MSCVTLEVLYDEIYSSFDVANYDDLKECCREDFVGLNGKEFSFFVEVDGKKMAISNERTFEKFASQYGDRT